MPIKRDEQPKQEYIRVGTDYFKIIYKPDRFEITRTELKKWSKEAIILDHHTGSDKTFIHDVPKYDDFIIVPNNNGAPKKIHGCYNMYHDFAHKPKPGQFKWTTILLKQIFGEQFKMGMQYLKVLYENPQQPLPVFAMVSEERQTGKSTFLDWLNMVFGANMAMIEPDVIGSNFNGEYATSNIIAIDETILDKQIAVEKIKSLATKKFISVNIKNVAHFKLPFFGKIIMASNSEAKFMRVDSKEIRFWVRKIGPLRVVNHNILNDMINEIPAFLNYLTTMNKLDFSLSRMVFTADQLKNDTLDAVKNESRSGLHKELEIKIIDWFNNNDHDEFEATATDIKNRWFARENNISTHYITSVLRHELMVPEQDTISRYSIFNEGSKWVGKPFLFTRNYFKLAPNVDRAPF